MGVDTPQVLQETNREDFLRSNADPNDTAIYRTRSEYTYVYGVGLVSVTDGLGNQQYVLPDALGSVRTLSNGADGSAYATYSYDAFGAPRTQEGPHTTFRFAGEQYDLKAREQGTFGLTGTNGLYFLRARYYDPSIGRFLTRDPLPGSTLDPQSQNPYPYVGNNPVNLVDPRGMVQESGSLFLTTNPDIGEFIRRVTQCPEAAELLVGGLFAFAIGAYSGQPTLVAIGYLAIVLAVLEYQQECLPPQHNRP